MRALRGHPWAFLGEVEFVGEPPVDGDCVELTDLKGRCLGAGLWNGKSQIAWRRYSRRPITLDGPLLEELVTAAVNRRAGKPVCRLIWSEADSLPGLVVDRYNDLITIQALTCGIDRRLATIIDVLQRLLKPREIVLRNDAATRKLEGLRQEIRTVSGQPLEPAWMEVGGVQVLIDLMGGQKTGTYLDQLDQHQHVAKLAQGRRVVEERTGAARRGGHGSSSWADHGWQGTEPPIPIPIQLLEAALQVGPGMHLRKRMGFKLYVGLVVVDADGLDDGLHDSDGRGLDDGLDHGLDDGTVGLQVQVSVEH